MSAARCGQAADLSGFRARDGLAVTASDGEFQQLCAALAAVADRLDADAVLEQAKQAVGWEG